MKTLIRVLAVVLLTASFLTAQSSPQFGGRVYASAYAKAINIIGENTVAAGSATFTFSPAKCQVAAGNRNFTAFATTAPLKIVDAVSANTETVTPSAVSVPSPTNNTCSFTATVSNAHSSYIIQSGTGGVQEAVNDNAGTQSVIVVEPGNIISNAQIKALANGQSSLVIEDLRAAAPVYWALRPTAVTQIAAPTAPTVTAVTGSLSSGAYRVMVAYVDAFGGVSLASTDSTQTATTTGLSITSPAASAGAVGYLPYITAAGGGAGSEILAKAAIDSTICTLTTLETVVPACAIGATATVTAANPSATAKPVVESTAFTTAGYQPFNMALPAPFVTNYTFGTFVATATLNNSNADAAQFQVPAGFFNDFNHGARICIKGATATAVAGSILTVNLNVASQYAQSPVTLSAIAFATQTRAAAGTFQGCWIVQTSTTGASGKMWAMSDGNFIEFLNSAAATQVIQADSSAAQSSAVDLTKQLWFSVNLAESGSQNLTGPIINSLTITPIGG